MIDSSNVNSVFDAKVVDSDGAKVGTVKQIYVDKDRGQPLFASVATGLFGTSESFVPLRDAVFDGDELHVRYDKGRIKDAPRIDADGDLTDDEQDRLWDYYTAEGDEAGDHGTGQADDADTTSPPRDRADDDRQTVSRVRLRKHVVTEQQTITVPVQREEVIAEPIPDETESDGSPNDGRGRTGRHSAAGDGFADGPHDRRDEGTEARRPR